MAKNKIPKNRSLEDMFAGVKEGTMERLYPQKRSENPGCGRQKVICGNNSLQTTCRKKWGPSYWILNWPIIRTVSAIYRCKWLKTAGTSLSRRLRKPENTIHKVVLQ